jgi:hypothetical protein
MSAIAEFRIIEVSNLNELMSKAQITIEKKLFNNKIIDNYNVYLDTNSKKLKEFNWSGYIFANLLILLEERGISLLKSQYDNVANDVSAKRKNSTIIFTFEHKQKYSDELLADKFTLDELIEFNKEFYDDDDPELVKAELEGIRSLKENLELIPDDSYVVLLSVG